MRAETELLLTLKFEEGEEDIGVQDLIDWLSDYSGGTIENIDKYSFGYEIKIVG